MDFNGGVTLDAFARYVDTLPDPQTDPYLELSVRVAWDVSRSWQIARSFFVEARWRN